MSKPFRFGSAFSLIALSSVLAGCATPATHFGGKTGADVGLATRALVALNSHNVPLAIELAERAVTKNPEDAGFRALLGNAYFAGGRFASAEAAYKDSLTLYSNQPQVVLKLALVQIAQGKNDQAVEFLNAGRFVLEPANYGLALALAGRPDDAIPVLEAAAREEGADAQVRQNLALAYALQGNWTESRTIAAQDVPANQLDARIQQWMQFAKPSKASDQVAALLGVKPAAVDQGQPVQLALRKTDTVVAQAGPARAPAAISAAPAPVSQAPAAHVAEASAPAPVAEQSSPQPSPAPQVAEAPKPELAPQVASSPAPVTMAMLAVASPEAPSAFAAVMPKAPAPVARSVKIRRAAAPAPRALRKGDSVVQLGAYKSPQAVSVAWNHITARYPALRSYLPLRARFDSPKGTFWRLSIQGFGTQREAIARCQLLKSHGGACFVRGVAGDAPVEYASR